MSKPTALPSVDAPCVKCGKEEKSIRYRAPAERRPPEDIDEDIPDAPATEYMRATCKSCGYAWAALPLDAKGGGK